MVAIEYIEGQNTFTINNISLVRNFHAYVSGTKVRIVNAYDTRNEIMSYTLFSDISLNGQNYNSVAELVLYLTPVLFLKKGGSGTGNVPVLSGNIITKTVPLAIDWSQNPDQQVVDFVNNQEFSVSSTQRILFKAVRITGDLNNSNSAETYFWEFKPGKGNYGTNGIDITLDDIEFISYVTNYQNNVIDLGEINATPIEVFVNDSGPYLINTSVLNVFKATRQGNAVNYIYVGNSKNIGDGQTQTISDEYIDVNATPTSAPASTDGKSAYQVAVEFGFVGTEEEWLESLEGLSAYDVAVAEGFQGTRSEWLESLGGIPGASAYDVAVENGFVGTEAEWLASLKGGDGDPGEAGEDGRSAYQIWIDAGNTGTEQDFLNSLKGNQGDAGQDGDDGRSAYQIWLDAGNAGTEQEFLDSLKGDPGEVTAQQLADGVQEAKDYADNQKIIEVSTSRPLENTDHDAILLLTANVTLNFVPGNLRTDFACELDADSTGQGTITDNNTGGDLDAPDGNILEAGKIATIYRRPGNEKLRLKGEFIS